MTEDETPTDRGQGVVYSDGGSSPVSLDEVFELLSSERRRYALYELRDEEHLELAALAERVAARETGCDEPPAELVDDVTVDLHHRHLPKLDEARLVDYDPRQWDISPTDYFDLVEKYLDLAEQDDES